MPRARGVLAARSISKSFGDTVVLDGVSLTVSPKDRIGVLGPNGIGKSTLLRLLAGLEQPDSGTVSREPATMVVTYLAQESHVPGRSGGEAAREQLQAILTTDADVLLLDEPTNDLDFAGLELLERFLGRHRGGLVVVSHDRAFLERMNRIVELEAETRRVREFAGGWSEYAAERSPPRRAARGGLRAVLGRARADRGAGAPDAAVGGARLRAGPQEEEGQGRRQGVREEALAARAGREAVGAVAAPARPHTRRGAAATGSRASRARSSSATASGSGRSTSSWARATGWRSSAATAPARRRCCAPSWAIWSWPRAGGGSAPGSCSASCRRGSGRSRATRRCSTPSRRRPASRRARRVRCSRSSRSAPTTSTGRAAPSHRASAAARRSRCSPREA